MDDKLAAVTALYTDANVTQRALSDRQFSTTMQIVGVQALLIGAVILGNAARTRAHVLLAALDVVLAVLVIGYLMAKYRRYASISADVSELRRALYDSAGLKARELDPVGFWRGTGAFCVAIALATLPTVGLLLFRGCEEPTTPLSSVHEYSIVEIPPSVQAVSVLLNSIARDGWILTDVEDNRLYLHRMRSP